MGMRRATALVAAVVMTVSGLGAIPANAASGYSFLDRDDDGVPARWNPCVPITYKMSGPGKMKPPARTALRKVAEATGIAFTETKSNPQISIEISKAPGWSAAGYGGAYYQVGEDQFHVYDDGSASMIFGKKSKKSLRTKVAMQAIGRALGLGNAKKRNQIMSSTITRKKATWGKGDLKGLARVGRQAGCLNPPPAPTNVRYSKIPDAFFDDDYQVTWDNPPDRDGWAAIAYGLSVDDRDGIGTGAGNYLRGSHNSYSGLTVRRCEVGMTLTVSRHSRAGTSETTVPFIC